MKPKLIKKITPPSVRSGMREFKFFVVIFTVLITFMLLLSIFVSEARFIVYFCIAFAFCLGVAILFGVIPNIYSIYLFDDHLEIKNWIKLPIHSIYYTDIDIIKTTVIYEQLMVNYIWSMCPINTLCIGIGITDQELDDLIKRNTFMNLLRYSKICIPIEYDEDVYQFLNKKMNEIIINRNHI